MRRRNFLQTISTGIAGFTLVPASAKPATNRPNVIVLITDDQGNGDFGFMGNPVIRTPNLDMMQERSAYMPRFYVSPVCAPTRASLMTGRYNYRTRCIDTWLGRAMMEPDETTIAELMREAGYRTGLFGKWHCGDNYPMRPQDQGFDEVLMHLGGGIGQPSDPPGGEGKYTDPVLFHNGKQKKMQGYCTDIYFDHAMKWMDRARRDGNSFFAYIATNAPHGPFHDVPEKLRKEYMKMDFHPIIVNKMSPNRYEKEKDKLARIAAMITNIDENVGKLFTWLNENHIAENTIVMFMNDNGPNSLRYVGNMRGMKTNVNDGGIRTPFLFHWPKQVKDGFKSDCLAAHIDILPTILDACGIQKPKDLHLDGVSLMPVLRRTRPSLPQRYLFIQTHRGDEPVQYHHFAVVGERWKLVHPSGFGRESFTGKPKLELYDLAADPGEQKNVAAEHPDVFRKLKTMYDRWFREVSSTRSDNYAPPRIHVGTDHENPVTLTRQDWRHLSGKPWHRDSQGRWLLKIVRGGTFRMEVRFEASKTGETASVVLQGKRLENRVKKGASGFVWESINLAPGNLDLKVELTGNGKSRGPHQVVLERV